MSFVLRGWRAALYAGRNPEVQALTRAPALFEIPVPLSRDDVNAWNRFFAIAHISDSHGAH